MGAPELTNCCGVSLKYGTIIIGVVQSIFAFMCMILSAAYVKHPHELVQLNDASVLPQLEILRTMLIIISVASALQCIFSIMLVFGAAASHPVLLTPYLILNPVCLFIYIVGTLVAVVHHTGENNTPYIIGHLFISFVVTVIVSYKILIVHSYRQYLKRLNF
ncbi:uncharacterized protein LOC109535305 [Dendroctonus ponderosae]|uniref:Uncharacterized protein n=1 Tax=Dendroctonus ponderosae TaxID=77166 RepID=J3JWF9_DENPD|nr:uncharacterized protein LOC109535305 [Dendroctonus ponderosae]XP_019756750.1 uncharacterized protein LOC109535305 [Dendroctonus ponderosae]AEE62539.1 unknown [Dendroctonus ponderosae]KAH1022248.1 hypothetical protein HUJ04_011672 [Dendroctonus ponderosae]KAH1028821.1 hypothetical protein HUJ05_002150 [Dendroctonus ponderosae]